MWAESAVVEGSQEAIAAKCCPGGGSAARAENKVGLKVSEDTHTHQVTPQVKTRRPLFIQRGGSLLIEGVLLAVPLVWLILMKAMHLSIHSN